MWQWLLPNLLQFWLLLPQQPKTGITSHGANQTVAVYTANFLPGIPLSLRSTFVAFSLNVLM